MELVGVIYSVCQVDYRVNFFWVFRMNCALHGRKKAK